MKGMESVVVDEEQEPEAERGQQHTTTVVGPQLPEL